MKTFLLHFILLLFYLSFSFSIQASPPLVPVLSQKPTQAFEVLTPLGAGMPTEQEAIQHIQQDAQKVGADALIDLKCEQGGLKREGLQFSVSKPYCHAKAIRFLSGNKLEIGKKLKKKEAK